ncbi:MAG: nucleotidyltransferase domain-containing protein [Bacteroidetes bacterium]|nr:nucleotidyltransferase domain-containing protein [Fibrella sp.]
MHLHATQLQAIQRYLVGKPIIKAYLFGSYARGEADDSSDIDLLVELDYAPHIGLGFILMKLDLETQLKKSVHLVSEQAVSPYIRPFIEQDKHLIYERDHR